MPCRKTVPGGSDATTGTKESNTSYTGSEYSQGTPLLVHGYWPKTTWIILRLRSEERRETRGTRRGTGLRPETKEELEVAWLWVRAPQPGT